MTLLTDECLMCHKPVEWIRWAQFAGGMHPFCNEHAILEEDFGDEYWEKVG